ncbi:Fur family transcriptional regulator [Dysgonomonas macrotermitis]|uniref:Fur family transcriptional regulator, ferric uptake regulator n=1 Tax=Dysgonomonas macrotermitis TaxID=1346286 RepID=A0A1M5IE68_9BACT|nr:transcriptional repressor [Dysgonomonas macrotermitis]SHG26537.1 Fur family transcriptional regulator, ferric uptake regulator [Dysgonomonas macrotermitis]
MEELNHIARLEARNIKPTAVRLLIFKAMIQQKQAFSLSSLESVLDTVDKSTLSRTITLFHNNLLIHSIDDGSGSMKYSVCSSDCQCSINDLHVHFNCTNCKQTYCLESISIPKVQLPTGFVLQSVNFVMKGLCNKCQK